MAVLQFTVWDSAREVANGPVLNEGVVTIDATERNSPVMFSGYDANRTVRVRVRCTGDDAAVAWGAAATVTVENDGTDGRIMGDRDREYFDLHAGWVIRCVALGTV